MSINGKINRGVVILLFLFFKNRLSAPSLPYYRAAEERGKRNIGR